MKKKVSLLILDSFEDVVTAIQYSGYGTKSDALFLVALNAPLHSNQELINAFNTQLLENEDIEETFNSAVTLFLGF